MDVLNILELITFFTYIKTKNPYKYSHERKFLN